MTIYDIRKLLDDEIQKLTLKKDNYVKNPGKDFTRNRKITFSDVILNLIHMEAGSLRNELLEYFSDFDKIPTVSAFIQQRDKISSDAFKDLFYSFTHAIHAGRKDSPYRFFAVDGSVLKVPTIVDGDKDYTYFTKEDSRSYCQMHMDAIYDLEDKSYVGINYCPRKKNNERKAFHSLFEELSFPEKSVFVFDRGYEGYALMAHISSKNQYFVIRAKDQKTGGIINGLPVPESEIYDYTHDKIFVHKMRKTYKRNPERYHVVHKTKSPYFLNKETKEFPLKFRAVRFQLDNGSYECLLTNLPADQFDLESLKEIYHMRWEVETSFRYLKYAFRLLEFHSKKEDAIKQEIWSRLIMYNFCSAISKTVSHKQETKRYQYKVNFENLILICRCLLLLVADVLQDEEEIKKIQKLISREISPVRPGRNNPRKKTRQRSMSFNYR